MNKQITLFLALGILLFSCKLKKEKKAEPIKKIEPKEEVNSIKNISLDEIVGNYYITSLGQIPELNEVIPTVKIDETGKIVGNNGCNSFFGQLNLEDGNLINNLGSTRKACEGEKGDIERMMMATLKEVSNITADEQFIKFYSDDNIIMKGKKLSLEMGSWEVISIEGKIHNLMPNFQIENNRLNGNTGCNSFFGMIQQDGFNLKILETGATEMACPEFDSTMESMFMQALGQVTQFKFEGGTVIFLSQEKELFRASNPEQE